MKNILPIILLFILVTVLLLIFGPRLDERGFDSRFLIMANSLLFLLTWFGFRIVSSKSGASSPHAFMRGVYLSFLIKMFVIVGALFIFISVSGNEINKSAVFISMGLYIAYTSIEVIQLMKLVRSQKK